MASEGTLRIEARFKNARLYNAIVNDAPLAFGRTAAGATAAVRGRIRAWCVANDLPHGQIYALLGLRLSPLCRDRARGGGKVWRPLCLALAARLSLEPDYLFPLDLYAQRWPMLHADVDGARVLAAAAPSAAFSLPPAQEQAVIDGENRVALDHILHTLTPREEQVIRYRYGLDRDELTLSATGRQLGVGPERIRQIEAKALRKLRKGSRADALKTLRAGTSRWR